MIYRVGILGFSRREGTFAEVGLRSWEEAGCAAVENALMAGNEAFYTIHRPLVVRPDRAEVERILRDWCDVPDPSLFCHLIFTIGGTGYSKNDFLPEVTRSLINRAAPGLAEHLRRMVGEAGFPSEAISRGVAGMRGRTLIINLPGVVAGIADPMPLALLTHALLPALPSLLASLQE